MGKPPPTGLSPSEFFIRLRMAEARRLLREPERSVIEIGLDFGCSSPSHFAQVFKREVGASPPSVPHRIPARGGRYEGEVCAETEEESDRYGLDIASRRNSTISVS